ncbi:hypothetical protein ABPG72_005569 [Tetrahymena utriculariae]
MLPVMIFQVQFLINFILKGPFFVYYEVDLQNFEDNLLILKPLQYFADFHFKNFTQERALQFMKQFLFLNPESFYSIKILNNNTDQLSFNQVTLCTCQQYFNINTNSSQMLGFFLEAFYMSEQMSNRFALMIFYYQYYIQFGQEVIDRIILNFDKFQIYNEINSYFFNFPSDFLRQYTEFQEQVCLNILVYEKNLIELFNINPKMVYYDLYSEMGISR